MVIKHRLAVTALLAFFLTPSLSFACNSTFFDECLDGVGPAVTAGDALRTSATSITNNIRQRNDNSETIETALLQTTGRSAGDTFSNWGFWGNYTRSEFDADFRLQNAVDGLGNPFRVASYDTTIDSFLIGADRLFNNNLVIGVALSYEDGDTDVDYNGGATEADGYTITPYLAYLFNDTFSVDVSAGYSSLDYDTDRIDNTNGNTILGSFDSDRWFVAANLNAAKTIEKWYISGRVGLLYTEEEQDAYTERGGPTARTISDRDIDLSQFLIGVDVAYNAGPFEPYANLTYLNDMSSDDGSDAGGLPGGVETSNNDDDEFQTGIGIRFFKNEFSGSIEWNKVLSRDDFHSDILMFTIRADI